MNSNEIIYQLEEILKANIPLNQWKNVNLLEHGNPFQSRYFSYLDKASTEKALELYPDSDNLKQRMARVQDIDAARRNSMRASGILKDYLVGMSDHLENDELKAFLKKPLQIEDFHSEEMPSENLLHKEVYSDLGELIVNNTPIEPHFELLYEWAINSTGWMNVAAYLLGPYLEVEENENMSFLDNAWDIHWLGIDNKYWIKDNDLTSNTVYWKSHKID